MGSEAYIDTLKTVVIPWMVDVADGRPFVFQQDGAPAHTAKRTLQFLDDQGIPYWHPKMWPPNSPDLAPLDYGVWPMVVAAACKERSPSIPVLQYRVNRVWKHNSTTPKIRSICRKFRGRLQRCIKLNGSVIE